MTTGPLHVDRTETGAALFRPYLPRVAATWLAEDPSGRAVDASLLGLDISGFTALSERLAARGTLGAEELITLISRCYSGLITIGQSHGGDVLKFRGDALLLLFEGPLHESRAANAAARMQAYIAEAGTAESSVGPVSLGMSAGVSSGLCHLFLVGAHHRELIVCGPAASATLQLEDEASTGETLVSARTAEALDGLVGEARGDAYVLRSDVAMVQDGPALAQETPAGVDLAELVPPPLRAPIEANAIEAEHRFATAAFVKYGGTDALVSDLAAAAEALGELAALVSETTEELGVTWLESDIDRDGGKLYLVAGAPASHGGDEERMLEALRTIVDARPSLPISAGVNRGPVLAGPIGSDARWTYAVMGDTVNLAARLAARAEKGEILATGDVLQRSRTRYATSSRQFLMKGKEKPVTGHAVGAVDTRVALESRARLPLVGREHELTTIRAAIDAARLRQGQALELVGNAGIGKSRLVEELPAIAVGFQHLVARCEEYTAATPFAPFGPVLRPLVGVLPDEAADEAGAKLTAFVSAVMPDLAPWLPLLALPFDAFVAPTVQVDEIDPSFRRDKLHEVVDQLLTRLLLMPTAIVVEDAHWLDDASQLLVRRLSQPFPRPWLVCVTRRDDGRQVTADTATVLELAPLEPAEVRSLALAAAGDLPISEERLDGVLARAGGNPLFVRELVAAKAGDDALPETIQTLLTTRLDTLPAPDRLLLRHAAVIGRTFDLDLLESILPGEEGGDPDRWLRLREFVEWREDGTVAFTEDLLRAAAYAGLSYAVRREIHGRVAEALERRAADAAEIAPLLSLHWFEAGVYDKAWGYAVAAGDDARGKYANVDAATLYERALAAAADLPPNPSATCVVAETLGDVYELTARYDDAALAYGRASAETADATAVARLMRKQGVLCERTSRYDEACDWYERALADETRVEAAEVVEIENAIATVCYRQGRLDECVEWCERAVARAEAAGERRGLAHAYYVRAAAESNRAGPARDYLDQALPIYEELNDLVQMGIVVANMGVPAYYLGDWDEAVRCYALGRQLAMRAGDVVRAANATTNLAEVLLDQGRLDEARAALDDALRAYRASGFAIGAGLARLNLGRASALAGAFAEAGTQIEEARASFEEMGAESFALTAAARLVEAYVLEGRHADALPLGAATLEQMVAAGELGAPTAQVERLLGYAHAQARDPAAAAPHFAESLRMAREAEAAYEEALTLHGRAAVGVGEPGDVEAAHAILDRLGVVSLPQVPLP